MKLANKETGFNNLSSNLQQAKFCRKELSDGSNADSK